jgi:ABC-type uncharacterized transport system permease subunit
MKRFSLSIFTLAHRHAAHPFVLSITFFHYVPHVLILNSRKGSSLVSFLKYSNGYFVISQILSNMLEINVYLIIDSKVLGGTFCVNFLFSIIESRFKDCKHMMKVENIQLSNKGRVNTTSGVDWEN